MATRSGYGSTIWDEERIDDNVLPPTRTLKKGATTNLQTMMHMFKGNIGTGILAMPYAFSNIGAFRVFRGWFMFPKNHDVLIYPFLFLPSSGLCTLNSRFNGFDGLSCFSFDKAEISSCFLIFCTKGTTTTSPQNTHTQPTFYYGDSFISGFSLNIFTINRELAVRTNSVFVFKIRYLGGFPWHGSYRPHSGSLYASFGRILAFSLPLDWEGNHRLRILYGFRFQELSG